MSRLSSSLPARWLHKLLLCWLAVALPVYGATSTIALLLGPQHAHATAGDEQAPAALWSATARVLRAVLAGPRDGYSGDSLVRLTHQGHPHVAVGFAQRGVREHHPHGSTTGLAGAGAAALADHVHHHHHDHALDRHHHSPSDSSVQRLGADGSEGAAASGSAVTASAAAGCVFLPVVPGTLGTPAATSVAWPVDRPAAIASANLRQPDHPPKA